MAPTQPRKSKIKSVYTEGSEAEEDEQPDQGNENDPVQTAFAIIEKHKTDRQNKRKDIEKEYEQRHMDIGAKIDALFEARKIEVTESQQLLWERLETLNSERQDIEARILASMKNIEQQTSNISREIVAALNGRIEDVQAPSSPLK